MLVLQRKSRAFIPVPLPGGASINLRTADSADFDVASSKAKRDMAGLLSGSEAGPVLAAALGDEFKIESLKDVDKIAAAAERLAQTYLVVECNDGWSGVELDGDAEPELNAGTVAILLDDPNIRQAIMEIVRAPIHRAVMEKNGSAASPDGTAKAAPASVPSAGSTDQPAPPA